MMKSKYKKKVKKSYRYENQIRILVMFMVVLFLSIIIFYWVYQKSKIFEYVGLEFVKGKQGNLILYKTKFPLRNETKDIVAYLPFYFREDPRKLESIEIRGGNIVLKKDVALVPTSGILECEDSILSASTMALFLQSVGLKPFGATINQTEAEEIKLPYVNCDETREHSIILFGKDEENEIMKKGDCYFLSISNCEIMNVTERFMIGLWANSRGIEL